MPYLPDDILLNCLARVSILYYPTLSLVSKRFRSLIASTELYKIRRSIGSIESCPYVSIWFADSRKPLWFTLSRRPSRIPKPRWFTLSGRPTRISKWLTCCFSPRRNFMTSVPNQKISTPSRWQPATIGSSIYMIGGYINSEPSSRVIIMECGSHTWHEAPSMQVAQWLPCVSVVDGKIYVVERCADHNSSNFMEFFNPETQIWEHAPIPAAETGIRGQRIYRSFAYQGNLYVIGVNNRRVVYKPKENKWEAVLGLINGIHFTELDHKDDFCMIDNVLYAFSRAESSRRLEWYNSEGGSWTALKGLKDLPKFPKIYSLRVRLLNDGGKLVVFWEEDIRHKTTLIWCAEIAIEMPNKHEAYGKVNWCDVVLTVPHSCSFSQLVLPTV